jgi:hypothetical protein
VTPAQLARVVSVACCAALLGTPAAAGKKAPPADTFVGTVVTLGGTTSLGLGERLWLRLDTYTTDEEIAEVVRAWGRGGQDAMREALHRYRAGTLRVGTNSGYPIAIARQRRTDSGQVVLLFIDRPIQGFELQEGLLSRDYPFAFVELKLDAQGRGEGTVVGLAKLEVDPASGAIVVKSYGAPPSRVTNVRRSK